MSTEPKVTDDLGKLYEIYIHAARDFDDAVKMFKERPTELRATDVKTYADRFHDAWYRWEIGKAMAEQRQ